MNKFKKGDYVICLKVENALFVDYSNHKIYQGFINELCQITRVIPKDEKDDAYKNLNVKLYYDYSIKIVKNPQQTCCVYEKNLVEVSHNLVDNKKKASTITKLIDI